MLTTLYNDIKHYAFVGMLLVLAYFLGSSLLGQYMDKTLHGPVVSVTQPTPAPGAATVLNNIAEALKDKALAEALANQAPALSASQQTIANTIAQTTGINARLAAALADGLTRPSPKQQVITVATHATNSVTPPPLAESDDQIQRDMKSVLASTTINTHVDTTVKVSWEDRPYSPIFAVYGTGNESGVGYTLHRAPALALDALFLTSPSGVHRSFDAGIGLEHIFKGTSAGIGIDGTYNFQTHAPSVGAFVGIHF